MEGRDRRTVIDRLQEMDYLPVSVAESPAEAIETRDLKVSSVFNRVTRRDILTFTQQLSTLFAAGLEMDRSLQIIISLTKKPRMRAVVEDLKSKVEEGSTLADALRRHPRVFANLYTGMVQAGEAGGALGPILQRLAGFLETAHATRAQIISQLVYPSILTVAGGAAVAAWLLFRQFLKRAEGRLWLDRWKLRMPLLGELIKKIEVSRFARTLGTLLSSGVPILQAVSIVRDTMTNRVLASVLDELTDAIRAGRPIALPLRASGSFPPLATQLITVGEETGRLEEMLLKVADIFDQDVETTVRRLTALVEPAIILVMGIVVGFIVFSILLAIFSITAIPI